MKSRGYLKTRVKKRRSRATSRVVEFWFAVADYPKSAHGADVVTKATKV